MNYTGNKSFVAGWMIDGSGRPPEKSVSMTVAGGKIRSFRNTGVPVPGKKETTDLTDCTILPGLIDSHVHLFMSGTQDLDLRKKQLVAGFDTVREDITRRLRKCLSHGVIAVRDGGDRYGHTLAYRQGILDALATPVKVLAAGRAWRREDRYGKLIGRPPEPGSTLASSIKDSLEKVDHVKIVNSGLNSLVRFGRETRPQFTLEEMEAAVLSARQMGLRTMVHANGKVPVDIAVKAGCDSIEHGFFMGRDNLAQMADRQTVWVPTAGTMKAYINFMGNKAGKRSGGDTQLQAGGDVLHPVEGARKNLDHQLEQIALARQLGVPVAAGTDSGSPGVDHGKFLGEEIGLLITAGFSVSEAIGSAARVNAQLMGMHNDGLLAVGRPATFVVVKGPPENIPQSLASIESLFVEGERWAG